jgi:hypothetical protein
LSIRPPSSDAPLTNRQTASGFLQKMVGIGEYDLIGEEGDFREAIGGGALGFRFSFVGVVQKVSSGPLGSGR